MRGEILWLRGNGGIRIFWKSEGMENRRFNMGLEIKRLAIQKSVAKHHRGGKVVTGEHGFKGKMP